MQVRPSVAILQYRLLHYRLELFEHMRSRLSDAGVELVLVHGQASETEKLRRDEGQLPWATRVTNTFFRMGGKDIVWQPFPSSAKAAALIITMQENRILSNYVHQIRRVLGGPLVGFWGHGKNFQSTNADGVRERWKRFWINKVDWWFSYTTMSTDLVLAAGYPPKQITTLNNAIDVGAFQRDLAGVTEDQLASERRRLSIPESASVGLFCGSLYPEKKIDLMLASADAVRQRIPGFQLLVIGDGPSAHEVKTAAATRPWIHVLGVRKGQEKALYFRLSAIQLNPGLVGLHVLDALSAGLPMVTTANALHSPEIAYLQHGVNGWVCDDDDPQSYADALIRLFSDDAVRTAMSARCIQDSQLYTVEKMAENFSAGIVACLRHHGLLQ